MVTLLWIWLISWGVIVAKMVSVGPVQREMMIGMVREDLDVPIQKALVIIGIIFLTLAPLFAIVILQIKRYK